MRLALAIVIACAGCKGFLGIDESTVVDGGARVDAMDDASVDAMDDAMLVDADLTNVCYGQAPYEVCPGITGSTSAMPTTIDTANVAMCDFIDTTNNRNWCVIVRTDLTISAGMTANGVRPLVLLARHDLAIELAGMIDAASHEGARDGPGSSPTGCTAGNGQAGGATGQGSGAAGGTFGTAGGNGGKGHGAMTAGGAAQVPIVANTLRGGCAGGTGGGTPVMPGGVGGGAIYLVAGNSIRIEGTVNASGAGGGGGLTGVGGNGGSGGGGGGSGGMIVISAPTLGITSNAQVFANGGGGGSGGGNNINGEPGTDPTNPITGALGGVAGSGGFGGRGAFLTTAAVAGTDDGAGGGGGGGGNGVVRVLSTTPTIANNVVSPPPS